MKQVDLRTLSPESRLELKKICLRLYKKGDRTKKAIAEELGLRYITVSEWLREYKASGEKLTKEKPRGRPLGVGRDLTPEQEKHIQKLIIDKTPDQLKLDFALWSIKAVQQLIDDEFSIDLAYRTVCLYLNRWGFTPQRPVKRSYEQQPAQVQQWLDEDYPAIHQRAQDEDAEIHWGDETGISSQEHYPRGYAPKGQTPVLVLSHAKRERVNMVSTITNQGKLRFMVYDDKFTAQVFIKFLKQLIKQSSKKVFLIVDNLRVHHAKLVQEWLAGNTEKIEVFYLPSYSPELNPDEYLNCDLKRSMGADKPTRKKGDIAKKLDKHMNLLQQQPERIQSYFKHQKIKYAA